MFVVDKQSQQERLVEAAMSYKYNSLSEENKSFIKEKIKKSSELIKKWASFYPRKEKVAFRWSVLSDKPNTDKIPENLIAEFENDRKTILIPKKVIFSELGNKTIEVAVIEGHIPLLYKWSYGDADIMQELFLKSIFALYYFTDETKEITSFLRRVASRYRSHHINKNRLIVSPSRHYVLKNIVEQNMLQNPNKTREDVFEDLKLNSKQRRNVNSHITKCVVESLYDSDGLRFDPVARQDESEVTFDISEIDNFPLSDLERKCVIASLNGKHGWKSELARSLVNPSTKRPYSKMTITHAFKTAISVIKKHWSLNE